MYEVFHFVHDVQAPFVIRVDTEERKSFRMGFVHILVLLYTSLVIGRR